MACPSQAFVLCARGTAGTSSGTLSARSHVHEAHATSSLPTAAQGLHQSLESCLGAEADLALSVSPREGPHIGSGCLHKPSAAFPWASPGSTMNQTTASSMQSPIRWCLLHPGEKLCPGICPHIPGGAHTGEATETCLCIFAELWQPAWGGDKERLDVGKGLAAPAAAEISGFRVGPGETWPCRN